MKISFALCLPRDGASVPVVRHVCRDALMRLGVGRDCVSDIEVAVTEACANVLHATTEVQDEYEVRVDVDEAYCEIRVIDQGTDTTELSQKGLEHAPITAESGRGIYLMRALVDDLSFVSDDRSGTEVHLRKKLVLEQGSLLRELISES